MSEKSTKTIIPEYNITQLFETDFIFLAANLEVISAPGFIYTLGEILEIGDGDDMVGKEHLIKALNFYLKESRLSQRPTIEKIKSAFEVRVLPGDQQVLFADPLEVREVTGTDAGFVIDRERVTTFGGGDFDSGLERLRRYFGSIYERDGTIRYANTNPNVETPGSAQQLDQELERKKLEKVKEEAQQKKLEVQTAVAEIQKMQEALLKKVADWEKEVEQDPAS